MKRELAKLKESKPDMAHKVRSVRCAGAGRSVRCAGAGWTRLLRGARLLLTPAPQDRFSAVAKQWATAPENPKVRRAHVVVSPELIVCAEQGLGTRLFPIRRALREWHAAAASATPAHSARQAGPPGRASSGVRTPFPRPVTPHPAVLLPTVAVPRSSGLGVLVCVH